MNVLFGKRYIDWHLDDSRGQPPGRVREIRDDVAARVEALPRGRDDEGEAH